MKPRYGYGTGSRKERLSISCSVFGEILRGSELGKHKSEEKKLAEMRGHIQTVFLQKPIFSI